ncbi:MULTISPECIES: hypothetical protein [unclassified Arthrobacter]|uniref:hypothetical protein n=1 Tax=unclassified Arthrobacter TaxID=235627 RepID=UPI001D1581D7|nr:MULTISPECIES: hypothetical protein [unclassified Arthrobacter]MCC3290917.1 hypothetical protein [Arthrobacter sp. zg-Y1110]MCC3301685.1 hypothetical protein [Arthrobacter sp. zg-Y895]UWX86331.1 hypothetical protein N2K99_07415 [Arthrobacter sp. zg-Y1110]
MRVVRTWRGVVRSEDLEAYVEYVRVTGIDEYRATAGNLGAWILTRSLEEGRSEIVTVSLWVSLEAIRAFAGDDVGRAVFYPEDDRYLLERDRTVSHYDLAG